jgi:hypothetical protein
MSFSLEKYSEKAYVLYGDTILIKDQLKDIEGCSYRPKIGDKQQPGWFLKKEMKSQVEDLIQKATEQIKSGSLKQGTINKTKNTPVNPYKETDSSNIVCRLEILETKLNHIESILLKLYGEKMSSSKTKSNTNTKSNTTSKSISNWADEEESDEEEDEESDEKEQGSLLQAFRQKQK